MSVLNMENALRVFAAPAAADSFPILGSLTANKRDALRRPLPCHFFTSLAQLSFSGTVRLKTGSASVESGSLQK